MAHVSMSERSDDGKPVNLCFNNVQFKIIDRDGQPWITSRQLAQALGYKDENSVRKIYERNQDEFSPMMSATVKMTVGITEVTVRPSGQGSSTKWRILKPAPELLPGHMYKLYI